MSSLDYLTFTEPVAYPTKAVVLISSRYMPVSYSILLCIALALTVSDVRHGQASLEPPAHTSINTLRLPPARVLDTHKPVRLMPRKLLGALLHDIGLVEGLNSTHG